MKFFRTHPLASFKNAVLLVVSVVVLGGFQSGFHIAGGGGAFLSSTHEVKAFFE
jgi:hypothetical protein